MSDASITSATPMLPGIIPLARRRFPVLIVFSFLIAGTVVLCAILGQLIAPQDAQAQNLLAALSTPNPQHWFGTDTLGRDVFSRVIVGARTAVIGPVLIALGAMVIGNILGLLAGYFGGLVDTLIMRWVDLMYALPGLLVAIVVVGVLGGGYDRAVILLIILTAPTDTRLIRAATLEQRPRAYVEAVRVLGFPGRRIMLMHIWPNVLPIVVANTFLNFAYGLVALSGLSFLGLGVGPGTPDWGRMLAENRGLLFDNAASALAPGILIVITAASVNMIGDWFFETLSDRGQAR